MPNKRTYQFGKSTLTLLFGDITESQAQVLVSSDDYYLSMGGGVSGSLLKAGGYSIALDAAKKVPAALGEVVVTTAGALLAQYIFHVVTIGHDEEQMEPRQIIRQGTDRCMRMLDNLHLCSIAFPAIGAGVADFDYEEVAAEMADVIAGNLLQRSAPIEVTIYLFDRFGEMKEIDFIRFFEEFAARVPRLASTVVADPCDEPATTKSKTELSTTLSETTQEIKMRRVHSVRKMINSLDEQRSKLEERLIQAITDEADTEIVKLREKLRENEELRLGYLNELKSLSELESKPQLKSDSPKKHLSVFVSSTYKDLVDHRRMVKDQIVRQDLLFRGMEHFGGDPANLPPAAKIIKEVRNADVYLGIFGVRYGSVDQATGLSMTELEFNEAEASNKPMLLYVMRDDASIKASDVDTDPNNRIKLDRLKRHMLEKYTVYKFLTVEDLGHQVYADLDKLEVN